MIIRTTKQHWTEAEIITEVEKRTGKTPVVTVDGLDITLEFGEVLPTHEEVDITAYFSGDHDLPTVEEHVANAELRDTVKTIAQSAVGVALNDLTTQQLKVLVGVLLWQAGAIDPELEIKPLEEWAR